MALHQASLFDQTVQQMAELGEKGEQLPELMRIAADLLDDGLQKRISRLVGFR